MKNNIPKVIHYCWFWNAQKSQKIEKCIQSWKKYCPDYEIKERNEENFDINMSYYSKTAYCKKKWAFVADYARMYILYHQGWIYLDTDVEVLKNIDPLLNNDAFTGYQDQFSIGCAVIWAQKWNSILKEFLDYYSTKKTRIILPNLMNKIFKQYHSIKYTWKITSFGSFRVYPKDYFYPFAYFEQAKDMKITQNTYMIHHYEASWIPKYLTKFLFPIIGYFIQFKK